MSYNFYGGHKAKKYEVTESFKSTGTTEVTGSLTVGGKTLNVGSIVLTEGTPVNAAASTLTTALDGENNDLVFTAATKGTSGDDITIAYIDPDEAEAKLAVSVSGTAITISLATNVSKAITSTASSIKTAIETDEDGAALLVTVANANGNNGEGVVTEMEATSLNNGADGTIAPYAAFWYYDDDYVYFSLGANTVADANWRKITATSFLI